MKLIQIVPLALFTVTTVACSESSEPGTATGGATGSGGTSATGGVADSGGTGGTTSTGGAASGGAASGGTATTGGADSGGTGGMAELTEDTLLPGINGLFWPLRAANNDDTGSSKYYVAAADGCPAEGSTITKEFTAAGDPAQAYRLNFELRGALALHCYTGGTPMATTADAAAPNEAFYLGGTSSGDSTGSQVMLTVTPEVASAETSTYHLNGIPADSATCDEGITYDVRYKGSFTIMGDSTVTLSFLAPGCQALQNCGADPATCAPRTVDVDGVEVRASSPQPVSDVFFEGDTQIDLYPQWLVFDIQSIDTL